MQADSAEQFNATKQSQVDKIQKNSYIDPPVSDNVYENTTNVYYQPYDFLQGFSVASGSKTYKLYERVSIPRMGLFGHCNSDYPLKFMENLPISSCV
jgi:hypothetical protein